MPSPFPGMDPYLEGEWPDVHAKLAPYVADALNAVLPADLIARNEQQLAVEADESLPPVRPDAHVHETIATFRPDPAPGIGVLLAPIELRSVVRRVVEKSVRIYDAKGRRLVTAIEILSPWNKRMPGLAKQRRKRRRLLEAEANVVEIDLIRSGDWQRLLRPLSAPADARTEYRATLWTADHRDSVFLHPMPLREKLPVINIPLRGGEPPARLDVQTLIETAYRNGRYERLIDYSQALRPPLSADDEAWADQLLHAAGRR